MAKATRAIDIDGEPALLRLVEEAREADESWVLRRDGEDVAVLLIVNVRADDSPRRARTDADYQAFLSSAGSWKDEDADRFLADNAASRRIPARPPVGL